MIALSEATGWVMLAAWSLVLLGISIMREDGFGAIRARMLGLPIIVLGLVSALVARVVT